MTYLEALRAAEEKLAASGVEEAALDAEYLLMEACRMTRTRYLTRRNEQIRTEEKDSFFAMIEKRANRIPLQHITGVQQFMGYDFDVTGDVLIPRQDTEILVETALGMLKERRVAAPCKYTADSYAAMDEAQKACRQGENSICVLDMCTGSGCIIISLAKLAGGGKYYGADISEAALKIASQNAKKLDADVTFLRGDLFKACGENAQYDMIVSNPPYIERHVIDTLQPEVREHDPMLALDGGIDGLDFYRSIISSAGAYLTKDGILLFEIGHDQGQSVSTMMYQAGFGDVHIIKDLAGMDRVVYGVYSQRADN